MAGSITCTCNGGYSSAGTTSALTCTRTNPNRSPAQDRSRPWAPFPCLIRHPTLSPAPFNPALSTSLQPQLLQQCRRHIVHGMPGGHLQQLRRLRVHLLAWQRPLRNGVHTYVQTVCQDGAHTAEPPSSAERRPEITVAIYPCAQRRSMRTTPIPAHNTHPSAHNTHPSAQNPRPHPQPRPRPLLRPLIPGPLIPAIRLRLDSLRGGHLQRVRSTLCE